MRRRHLRKKMLLLMSACIAAVAAAGAFTLAHAANESVAYTYDALGRVTTASYDTNVCIVYTYDPNGNRLSETINVTARHEIQLPRLSIADIPTNQSHR
jgi:hypothetical protein